MVGAYPKRDRALLWLLRATVTLIVVFGPAIACSPTRESNASSTTRVVGDQGGALILGDAVLEIPAGALAAPQAITITRSDETAPSGYESSTAVYRFDPEGLIFRKPATLSFATRAEGGSIIWSQGPDRFEPLATRSVEGRARADIAHFSRGFLGTPACEHATSCTVENAKCTFFASRCDAGHEKERRHDCDCIGGAWRHAIRETVCDGGTGGPCVLDATSKLDMCVLQ